MGAAAAAAAAVVAEGLPTIRRAGSLGGLELRAGRAVPMHFPATPDHDAQCLARHPAVDGLRKAPRPALDAVAAAADSLFSFFFFLFLLYF